MAGKVVLEIDDLRKVHIDCNLKGNDLVSVYVAFTGYIGAQLANPEQLPLLSQRATESAMKRLGVKVDNAASESVHANVSAIEPNNKVSIVEQESIDNGTSDEDIKKQSVISDLKEAMNEDILAGRGHQIIYATDDEEYTIHEMLNELNLESKVALEYVSKVIEQSEEVSYKEKFLDFISLLNDEEKVAARDLMVLLSGNDDLATESNIFDVVENTTLSFNFLYTTFARARENIGLKKTLELMRNRTEARNV